MRQFLSEYSQTVLSALTGGLAIGLACGLVKLLKPVIEEILLFIM